MVTLDHPTLHDVHVSVDESAAPDWVAQGWVRPAEPPTQPARPRRAATTKET